MARIQKKPQAKASDVENASASDGLAALHPNLTSTIAGREITVREYSFFESLEVAHKASALISDVADMLQNATLSYTTIRRLFGVHRDVVVALIAQSASVDKEWILGLQPLDAEILTSTWFSVNSGFFIHEAAVDLRERRAQLDAGLIGSMSSSNSVKPDLATSNNSGTSLSDS